MMPDRMAGLLSLLLPLVITELTLTLAQGSTSTLRLAGDGPDYGTLEILINGQWGTVCDDGFTYANARVACRQLGLDTTVVDYYPNARFGEGMGTIWLDNVLCIGTETDLTMCEHAGLGVEDCSHSEDVGISCGRSNVQVGVSSEGSTSALRLAGDGLDYGRLEILINGQWGTVCDDSFTSADARVACRQLGLDTTVVDYYPNAKFGEGSGTIWLDDVSCIGTEANLTMCEHGGIGINDCTHNEDVGISCGRVNVDENISSSGGGFYFSGTGWIGFVAVFFVIIAASAFYRRRRLYQRQQARATTTTTTVVTVPHANNPGGNAPVPTYYHGAPGQPGSGPPPTPAGGPGSYPTQQYTPAATYPPQSQPPAAGAPYPYPVQAYPPAQPNPAYPPQQADVGGTPYPPAGDVPPMYPPPAAGMADGTGDLPPPPAYTDVVKQ